MKSIAKTEAYQAAIASGGPRYDLDGNASGDVTEEQKANAVAKLRRVRAKVEKAAGGTAE